PRLRRRPRQPLPPGPGPAAPARTLVRGATRPRQGPDGRAERRRLSGDAPSALTRRRRAANGLCDGRTRDDEARRGGRAMIGWIAVGGATVAIAAWAAGARLPAEVRVGRALRAPLPPEAVWHVITDWHGQPSWRRELKGLDD